MTRYAVLDTENNYDEVGSFYTGAGRSQKAMLRAAQERCDKLNAEEAAWSA